MTARKKIPEKPMETRWRRGLFPALRCVYMSVSFVGPPLPRNLDASSHRRATVKFDWATILRGVVLTTLNYETIMAECMGHTYEFDGLAGKGTAGHVYSMRRVPDRPADGMPDRFAMKVIRGAGVFVAEFEGLELLKKMGLQTVVPCASVYPRTSEELAQLVDSERVFGQLGKLDGAGGTDVVEQVDCAVAMPQLDVNLFALHRNVVISSENAAGIGCVIAETARTLWASGVMLNDIKSENIMFETPAHGEPYLPRLVDFGCFLRASDGDALLCSFPMPEHMRFYEPGKSGAKLFACAALRQKLNQKTSFSPAAKA